MPIYTLYNKRLKKHLAHPGRGVWYTSDLEAAHQMMGLVKEYSDAVGVPQEQQEYVIVNAATGEELLLPVG